MKDYGLTFTTGRTQMLAEILTWGHFSIFFSTRKTTAIRNLTHDLVLSRSVPPQQKQTLTVIPKCVKLDLLLLYNCVC